MPQTKDAMLLLPKISLSRPYLANALLYAGLGVKKSVEEMAEAAYDLQYKMNIKGNTVQ